MSKSILFGLWKHGSANFILLGRCKPVVFIILSGGRLVIELNTQNFALNWVELTLDVTVKLMLDFEKEFVSLMPVKFNLPLPFSIEVAAQVPQLLNSVGILNPKVHSLVSIYQSYFLH